MDDVLLDISASVYLKTPKGVFFVKATVEKLGFYINSITVRQSIKYPDKGLWVQMPSVPSGGRFIRPLEFSKNSVFKSLIEDAALRAVDQYIREHPDDEPP